MHRYCACRVGDAVAWEQLLDRYERLVYSIARNNGLSPEDAADITQITFGYLLQSLGQMTDEGNLRAWLATVAKRHSRRLLVRQLRYQSAEVDEEIMAGFLPDRTNLNEIDRWELAEWLRHGLDRIDERCRQLLRPLFRSKRTIIRTGGDVAGHRRGQCRSYPRAVSRPVASGAGR